MWTLDTGSVAIFIILSASWVRLLRLPVSGVEASTICTLEGSHWRKSSLMNAPSVLLALSRRSCCIWQSSWNGFLSPNFSSLKSCCNLCCSDAAVCLTSCSLSVMSGLSLGGFRIKSQTSVANSGASEAMMWSILVFWAVIPWVLVLHLCEPPLVWTGPPLVWTKSEDQQARREEFWGVLLLFCWHQALLSARVHARPWL